MLHIASAETVETKMNIVARQLKKLDAGARLVVGYFVAVMLVFGLFAWSVGFFTSSLLEQRTARNLLALCKAVGDQAGDAAQLSSRIRGLNASGAGRFYVIDADDGKSIELNGPAEDMKSIKVMLARKEGTLRYESVAGRSVLAVFTPVKGRNWIVVGEADLRDINDEAAAQRSIALAVALVALVSLAVIQYAVFRRRISKPLAVATQAASKLSAGDLTTRVDASRDDDIGLLLKSINGIGQGLANVIWNIRHGAETLAVATGEIAAGNHDLALRTEQQAQALVKTATSMEEMTATVKGNADNARRALQLARAASEVAGRGGAVVGNVVHTMDSINQSSERIVDIIGVIDGIAFQTNILALNAAVEAARAGEQGRGFAVVAAEVRNLAQRSSAAAQEIKALIDASVQSVRNGSEQVAQAGATMQEVVSSIQGVFTIIDEITTASQEQSTGIAQVSHAMSQMDQGTQQNAEMVKQAVRAADALKVQTGELNNTVSVFKIKTAQHGSREEAMAMVEQAISSLAENGREETFAEISNKLGRFCDRDLYVVVYDMSGRNLAHGANVANVGKDMIDSKDGAGNLFIRERIAIIQNHGRGWQDYMFLNPVSKQMEAKSMYLDRHDDLIVGCGVYKS